VSVPQRLSFVTLGARSVASLRAFYASWGWVENDGSSDDYASFTAGSVRLALYPMDRLRDEAAPGEPIPSEGEWNGIALALNLGDQIEVDRVISDAVEAGAALVQAPRPREWGGYSGYVADPEGNRWELAWAPGFDPS
jgi:predicted lactoylglutathione lyase